jgi:hypothetical protein
MATLDWVTTPDPQPAPTPTPNPAPAPADVTKTADVQVHTTEQTNPATDPDSTAKQRLDALTAQQKEDHKA